MGRIEYIDLRPRQSHCRRPDLNDIRQICDGGHTSAGPSGLFAFGVGGKF